MYTRVTSKSILLMSLLYSGRGSFAAEANLLKVKSSESLPAAMQGYTFDTDQAFKVNAGALREKVILFAEVDRAATSSTPHFPKIVVAEGRKIIAQESIPTLEEGWNIVSVEAVSGITSRKSNGSLRVLAILTLEPISQRESDYWTQPFVFELTKEGKVDPDVALNEELASMKPRIASIKSLKAFLARNAR